jgi:hypothetical protein
MTAYFMGWTLRSQSQSTFLFAHTSEYAHHCGNRELADAYCRTLNRAGIEVPLKNDQRHVCSNFRVEQLHSGLVVYCDVPSAIQAVS